MWDTKEFKNREEMAKWLKRRDGLIQFDEIFIGGGFAVEWRPLRLILAKRSEIERQKRILGS